MLIICLYSGGWVQKIQKSAYVICERSLTHLVPKSPFLTTAAFQEMDANADGRVTQEEFVKACLNQETISKMLALKVIDIFTGPDT